jgi:nucleoside-diphosphate-sugar epimerase
MNIFVTVGVGFIGSNFTHYLSLKDIEGQKFEECEKYD